MSFKIGDKVRHKSNGAEGTIVDIPNSVFVEVESDGQNYFWHQANIDLIDDEYDDWDPDFGYWDRNYSFPFMGDLKEEDKCVCSSWDLFNFGCRCGFIEREKEREKQRSSGRGNLDRESKI